MRSSRCGLADVLGGALDARGLTSDALRIEITESLLVDTGSGAEAILHRLRAMGLELAVDDYGTGYSCLAYLHDLPVSYLKIDRDFTRRILDDPRTATIVGSTIDMAPALGFRVVAEGVETADQLAWLRAHGCDLLQGYHLSRPLPSASLHAWLAAHPAARIAGVRRPARCLTARGTGVRTRRGRR